MNWRQVAWHLKREEGLSWTELYDEIRAQFPELKDKPDQSIRTAVRNIDKKMNKPKQQPIPPPEDKMYDFTGSRLYKFGVVSDTHLNSKEQQLTHLNRMYDLFEAEGVSDVYHAGDITAGEGMFTGQIYEIFNVGFDNQANYIIKKYPQRRGITTHFITGNHDLSYYKSRGVDIGEKIALKRPDLNYLGKWAAWVKLGENTTMYILHPDSGPAYAISYRPQKIAAGFIGGEKPNIMILGHWHQCEYLFERNIHIVQAGCFESQSAYLKRKGIMPKIGGWIIEIHIDKNGSVSRFKPEFITFFEPVKDDY